MLQRENKHCILDVWGGEGLILDLKGITNLPDSGPKGVKIKYLHGILWTHFVDFFLMRFPAIIHWDLKHFQAEILGRCSCLSTRALRRGNPSISIPLHVHSRGICRTWTLMGWWIVRWKQRVHDTSNLFTWNNWVVKKTGRGLISHAARRCQRIGDGGSTGIETESLTKTGGYRSPTRSYVYLYVFLSVWRSVLYQLDLSVCIKGSERKGSLSPIYLSFPANLSFLQLEEV